MTKGKPVMDSIPNQSKLKYSTSETKLLSLIPKGVRPISTIELVDKLYDGNPPMHPRQTVTSIMASLMRKVAINREPFIIAKSDQRGPYPVEYRKVKRGGA